MRNWANVEPACGTVWHLIIARSAARFRDGGTASDPSSVVSSFTPSKSRQHSKFSNHNIHCLDTFCVSPKSLGLNSFTHVFKFADVLPTILTVNAGPV